MKTALFLTLFCLAFAAQAQQAERSMKVELLKSKPKPVFSLSERVRFNLVVITGSIEDQNELERLTVDDWRYDEPNYFSDGRVPNVVLHVERRQPDGRWEAVPFRASSQGGGASLKRLDADVTIEVFPGSSDVQAAFMLQLVKKAEAKKPTEEEFKKEMTELQKAFRAASLGDFRLTATYSGVSRKGGRIIIKAPPIEFKIQEAP